MKRASPGVGCVALPVFCLVSLVSAWGRNWRYLCGRIETVETGEIVEIGNIHAVFAHIAENKVAWRKRLGEYPPNLTHVPDAMAGDSEPAAARVEMHANLQNAETPLGEARAGN
jgi:hypothetical protein